VVFTSTSEVYGKNPAVPWAEDADRVLGPTSIDRWCYATSKAAAEHFCLAYRRLGLPVTILRFFNVYGPRLDKLDVGRVITIFLGQLLRGEPITVIGDGTQTRCFTWIDDAIRATVAAGVVSAAEGEIINVGTDRENSIRELAELIIKIGGGPSTIRYVPQESVYGDSYEDVPRRIPDVRRMKSILGVDATTPLADGLARTIAWFRAARADAARPAVA
jgi:UDP-glucose 4-epimerase